MKLKAKVMEKVLVSIGVFLFAIVSVLGYENLEAKKNYRYTLNDIYYGHYTSDEVFDVSLLNIRKEKGKEDNYEFYLQATPKQKNELLVNSAFDVSTNLSQSEFEKMIGSGNNSISSQVYVLELAVPAKYTGVYSNYYINIYRYSCFGENDFSEDEIKDFANLSLNVFCKANTSNAEDYDLSVMKENVECMKLYLSSGGGMNGLEDLLKLEE